MALLIHLSGHDLAWGTLILPARRELATTARLFSESGRERPWMLAFLLTKPVAVSLDLLTLVIRKPFVFTTPPFPSFVLASCLFFVLSVPASAVFVLGAGWQPSQHSHDANKTDDPCCFHNFSSRHSWDSTSLQKEHTTCRSRGRFPGSVPWAVPTSNLRCGRVHLLLVLRYR